jgi:hypothetical protein
MSSQMLGARLDSRSPARQAGFARAGLQFSRVMTSVLASERAMTIRRLLSDLQKHRS